MRKGGIAAAIMAAAAVVLNVGASSGCAESVKVPAEEDTVRVRVDSIPSEDSLSRYSGITDADFRLVAEELGVEVAAMKAVVEIEAGKQMKGFWAPGVPVVNFDRKM